MPWIAAAATIGGSLLSSSSSRSAARQQAAASDRAAQAQLEAARIAAEEARFRPVGISTRFGQSQFQFGPEGRLSGASYAASPEVQALQNRLSALYGDSLGLAEQAVAPAQTLFGLGQQYLAQSPEQARNQYLQEQYAMLDPIRQREEARLGASVFGRGRAGLNIGDVGQPELAALATARRTQDLQLAAGAEQAARDRIAYGTGLFGEAAKLGTTALSPFQTQFGVSQLLEQAALQPLDIGAQLGGRSATAGAQAGQSLLQGGLAASQTRLGGQQQQIGTRNLASQNLMKDFFGSLGFGQKQAPAPISQATPYYPMGTGSGSGFAYNPDIDTSGGYYGSSSGFEDMSGGYSPY
jgi:hypothetical protein